MPKGKDKVNDENIRINCQEITDEEIEEWVLTTRKVLIVLADESKDKYERIYQDFLYDLARLKEAERITDEDYDDILENL
ncbi:hypothetical protein C4544_06195 [candidate division WS5 bacterium]|uniref:Uncharacterized protein n=1 Tax=candidate division WS5 bacterium TaxID=2093353 RepID=A0A419D9Y7_9BACT|nr:MAG: hypothetical protein C4544_06195 [candidate division WS5 bacterium]